MNFDKINKYYNNIFLVIYIVSIIIYVLIFGIDNSTSIIKEYEIESDNSIIKKTSFTSVEYNNNKFNIPDELSYEVNNGIIIYNKKSWVSNIQILDYSYDDILKYSNSIKEIIEKYDYKIRDINEIMINNDNILIVEVDEENTHVLCFIEFNNYNLCSIEIVSMDSTDYRSILEQLIKIIKTSNNDNINSFNNDL